MFTKSAPGSTRQLEICSEREVADGVGGGGFFLNEFLRACVSLAAGDEDGFDWFYWAGVFAGSTTNA